MKKHFKKVLFGSFCGLVFCLAIGMLFAVNAVAQESAKHNEILARYDTNHDCDISISDVTATLDHLAAPESTIDTLRYDSNRDGVNSISDVTALLDFLATNTEKIEATLHSVVFKNNVNDAVVPPRAVYAEHIGMDDLPDDMVQEGYKFRGWSEKMIASDSDLIDDIPMGSAKNYTLYAQWDLVEYKITYKDAPINPNVTTYTVEDEVLLSAPTWTGLRFAYWTDEKNEKCDKIPEGTTGNITLTANWRSMENVAIPYKGIRQLWTEYNEEKGHQIFVYPLGEIQHVVLESLDKKYKYVGGSASWDESTTVAFDKGTAEEISRAVSNATSITSEYSESETNAKNHSNAYDLGFTVGAQMELSIESIVKMGVSFEESFNFSTMDENSWSKATTDSNGKSVTSEESLSNSSSVTFNQSVSKTFSTPYTVGENMPEGTYRYVYYGTVYVFAIVTYEPASGNYRMDTYSILNDADIGETAVYTPPSEASVNILPDNGLPYDISWTELDAYLENAYYVQYDSDGGEGKMMASVHQKGSKTTLSKNAFTKAGYSWYAWTLENGKEVYAGQTADIPLKEVDAEGKPLRGETVTVKAKWQANTYDITYDANGGYLPDGQSYSTTYTVESFITLPTPIYNTFPEYNHFVGWYMDKSCTVPFENDGALPAGGMTLYAKWNLATYYGSIDETPWTPAPGIVIVDWRGETDTNVANHTNRVVESGRYNNIDIEPQTTEIVFIGDPDKVYTNFLMHFCGFDNGQKLTVHFIDFNFVTNDYKAFGLYLSNNTNIVIDVQGNCSIGTSVPSGRIFGWNVEGGDRYYIKNLTFTGSGNLTLTAGNGADGSSVRANGGNGGVAIYAENLALNMTGTLTVYGGNGGNGIAGSNGTNGWTVETATFVKEVENSAGAGIQWIQRYDPGTNGTDGGNGGSGGNGGRPIECTTVTTNGKGTVRLAFGNGGNGANGGKGGNGGDGHGYYGYKSDVSYLHCWDPGKGGNGGDGGKGGNAGHAATGYSWSYANVTIVSGKNGSAGAGGARGEAGTGGEGGSTVHKGMFGIVLNEHSAEKADDGTHGTKGADGNP